MAFAYLGFLDRIRIRLFLLSFLSSDLWIFFISFLPKSIHCSVTMVPHVVVSLSCSACVTCHHQLEYWLQGLKTWTCAWTPEKTSRPMVYFLCLVYLLPSPVASQKLLWHSTLTEEVQLIHIAICNSSCQEPETLPSTWVTGDSTIEPSLPAACRTAHL